MTLLHFHNARLIDPETGTDAPGSLTVKAGLIAGQDAKAPKGATLVDCGGKCLAPGIVDWGVKIGEPGERHRESFRSAGLAAAAGGVTTIIARPDTSPAIDTPKRWNSSPDAPLRPPLSASATCRADQGPRGA